MKRLAPMKEGSLAEIAALFAPIIKMRPDGWSFEHWLDHIFHIDERSITEYICKKEFQMPGCLKVLPLKAIQGYGYRTVRIGTAVWVRIDTTDPDRIDVEVNNGLGKAEQVFQLTEKQFRSMRRMLNLKTSKCEHIARKRHAARST